VSGEASTSGRRRKSLVNTRVDNLQYGHFGQCSTKCKSVADTVTGHSCKIFTSLAAALDAAVFATVHTAAICVVGTILGVVTAQLVIQTVCQSTHGNKVSPLAP